MDNDKIIDELLGELKGKNIHAKDDYGKEVGVLLRGFILSAFQEGERKGQHATLRAFILVILESYYENAHDEDITEINEMLKRFTRIKKVTRTTGGTHYVTTEIPK